MRFRLTTLVDITETNARRGDNAKSLRQQQNFLTVLNTIGLRSNPTYKKSPEITTVSPRTVGLGSVYNKKQNVWSFEFEIEAEDGHSVDMLQTDFNLVPFIDGLDESALENTHFVTSDSKNNNIYFELIDK
jgi:hypothetical protein